MKTWAIIADLLIYVITPSALIIGFMVMYHEAKDLWTGDET